MIKISKDIVRQQKNFWNNCIFHPTDAIEDPWGKRILDRCAKDKAIQTVRIYAMFEDIVYEDENGGIAYDFRVSDLRLDYLVEKGYDEKYGARPLRKAIRSNIEDPLSDMFLSGALKDVATLKIDYRRDKFVFDTIKKSE